MSPPLAERVHEQGGSRVGFVIVYLNVEIRNRIIFASSLVFLRRVATRRKAYPTYSCRRLFGPSKALEQAGDPAKRVAQKSVSA